MKGLVLAGGYPQITLINKLKNRGVYVVLADWNTNPVAKKYCDKYYQVSTLDVEAITKVAKNEAVDFIITVCTDQALLTVAKVSEILGLPCYIDYQTALNVTNKAYMKSVFEEKGISTARYKTVDGYRKSDYENVKFPLIIKPVDCNSSKGVIKVFNYDELEYAIEQAIKLSRTKTAIVEDFIIGPELSVDVYVENGVSKILDITTSEKIASEDKFVIFRTWHPADVTDNIRIRVERVCQEIAEAFSLKNAPMLVQMITDGNEVYVLEFGARTGGGTKFLSIKRQTGFDVIDAVIDLTFGKEPNCVLDKPEYNYMLDEYIYCYPGIYDHLEGFEELIKSGDLLDYNIYREKGSIFDSVENSGDRIAGFTIVADTLDELNKKHMLVNSKTKVVSNDGRDIMHHDLLTNLI